MWVLLTGVAAARTPSAESPSAPVSPKGANQLLENALESERSQLTEVEKGLERWEAIRAGIDSEIESYQIQHAAHGNLLIVLETRVEDLQTALNNKRLAIKSLSERIAEFRKFGEAAPARKRLVLSWSWSYLVTGGAVLMELTGYGVFAAHWLVSWWEMLLLGLWAHIGWRVIQEWAAKQKAAARVETDDGSSLASVPVGWLQVLVARLFLMAGVVTGAMVAWSSTAFMAAVLKKAFNFAS